MPSKLSKVHKHISKKKGNKFNSLHENSRDAQRLRRAGARDDRVARLSAIKEKTNRPLGEPPCSRNMRGKLLTVAVERVMFFQSNLPDTLHPLTVEQIQGLVQQYLSRDHEALAELKLERRAGRPPSTRQTMFEQQQNTEEKEYESGLWMPDLTDEQTLQKLDAWNGSWVGLNQIRFVRVQKDGVVKESQWPPRGAS